MLNMRSAAIAVITSASLSLLAMSVAQAQGGEKKPTHRAIYNTTQDPSTITRQTPTWQDNYHGIPTVRPNPIDLFKISLPAKEGAKA